ncbi:MAG: HAD hydrolase family protein [Ignavibacteriaceae bacterium]
MQIIIDLDGTICTEEKTFSRSLAKPLSKAVETINAFYKEGHTIIIYSARTWAEFEMTTEWLKKNKVKYHQLMLGKPAGDIWIDDRAIEARDWDNIKKQINEKIKLKNK